MPQKGLAGSKSSASGQLATAIAKWTFDDVSSQMHEAKRTVLNFFATALCSSRDPTISRAVTALSPYSGSATSALIGRPERADALAAAFVNAISANLLDYDDTHPPTIIHPAAPVLAPVLALAEAKNYSGREVITALILGIEVECRIGNAVSPGHYARGWHITSTCGVFGAAAACAKLLGLDAEKLMHALGLAASQSAGVVENLASAAKNVSVGGAARNGLLAALLAKEGFDAAPFAIEGALGWARAMGDEPNLRALTAGLGESWEIARNTYKPYPAGIVFHAVIDACLKLRPRINSGPQDIGSVLVKGSPLLLARGNREVHNERDARVSIHHCVACALLRGKADLEQFASSAIFDPAIRAMREKVQAVTETALLDGAAQVDIHLKSGEVLTETVMHARGSLQSPLTDAEIENKLRQCAELGGSGWNAGRIIETVWALDDLPALAPLMNDLTPRKRFRF